LSIPDQSGNSLSLQALLRYAILLDRPDVFELLPKVETDFRRVAGYFTPQLLGQSPVSGNFFPVNALGHCESLILSEFGMKIGLCFNLNEIYWLK